MKNSTLLSRPIIAFAAAATLALLSTSALRAWPQETTGAESVRLRSGNTIQGKVVKKTAKALFVDVGYTILTIPAEEVAAVIKPQAPKVTGEATPAGKVEKGTREAIFFNAKNLRTGPVEEQARAVAESVVKVICAGGSDAPAKSGSGFVIDDEEGYVVTNYHVIEREASISLLIYTSTEKGLRKVIRDDVRIVAFNPYFDLALLKLERPEEVKLQKAYVGRYDQVQLGDPVFAIGSPLGLERSVSQGIVSSRNRAVGGLLYIQTTAAINPGNSGGALFNNRGEVIGVTNMKIPAGESLGFAIPAHHLRDFLKNFSAFAYDKDNPNTGIRYLQPPPKAAPNPEVD